jgi:tetratricopeptide (TPR) repeat protein
MGKYYASEGNGESTLRAINEFRDFVDSSHTSFVGNTGPYIVGNMYFTNKMYKEARQYLLKYVNDSPETELTPLAVLKAAVASEELNDFDKSISLLQRLESEYKGSIIGDQIYYHIARYYLKKNDAVNAKKYLEREITAFPMSPYALLAKERLLLLNITEKK